MGKPQIMPADKDRHLPVLWNGQTIRDALSSIDTSIIGGVVFVDNDRQILGFVTDGDIRRALIRGAELSAPVSTVWTSEPLAVSDRTPIATRYNLLKEKNIRHLILLNEDGRFAGLQTFQEIEDLYEINPRRCPVVLMAGGRGTRLMPLTRDCPKPMLKVGGEPLLQRTLNTLIKQGFEEFYISVNYLKEQIMEYFGDGRTLGAQISYLIEDEPGGTGGCLWLLPEIESRHFLLMNGDVITDLDFRGLITFHDTQKFAATMVVREVSSRVEYGIVRIDGTRFLQLDEKPTQKYFVNAGIYAINSPALKYLPQRNTFDMPELFDKLGAEHSRCGVFEYRGQWIDIGTQTQLEAARKESSTK